jgi:DNA polymerase III delta prime subunit
MGYQDHRMDLEKFEEIVETLHTGVFSKTMSPDGGMEGVLMYGPPGVGKTQTTMAIARNIARDNGMNLVTYTPGMEVGKINSNDCLYVNVPMAGKTSGSIAGFPTVSRENVVNESDSPEVAHAKRFRYASRQVIPEIWRVAREYPNAIYQFDEITHVISQEAMLSLLSEGFYEETKLAHRALFIATANEGQADGTLQQKLSTAFRNRFTSYHIKADVAVWRKQYANKLVHPACLAFGSLYKDMFENFKMPESNLENIPTLRSLTYISQSLTLLEAKFFRKRGEDGQLNPAGEWDFSKKLTPAHETMLNDFVFGRLGRSDAAKDFVVLYSLAFKTVIPEIKNIMNGKIAEVSPEFKARLSADANEIKMVTSASMVSSDTSKMKKAQDNLSVAFAYVDYLPREFVSAWGGLKNNKSIISQGHHTDPAKMRGYTISLMDRFLQGVMLLPSNMRMMAIQHMYELSGQPENLADWKTYSDVPVNALFSGVLNVLTKNQNNPDYKRLQDTFKDSRDASATLSNLGNDPAP